ncbi:MAG: hypothetical protein ABSG62_04850 [Terracidiphilus sp.]
MDNTPSLAVNLPKTHSHTEKQPFWPRNDLTRASRNDPWRLGGTLAYPDSGEGLRPEVCGAWDSSGLRTVASGRRSKNVRYHEHEGLAAIFRALVSGHDLCDRFGVGRVID